MKLNKKTQSLIEVLEFKKVYPDKKDKNFFWYQKDYLSASFLDPHLIICDGKLSFYTKDIECKTDSMIIQTEPTVNEILRLHKILS